MIKRQKAYGTDDMIKKICGCLIKEEKQTPSSLARCIDANPKTVQKYVEVANKLGILKCEDIRMGKNQVKVCRINPKYREILKELKGEENE